jgi:hypothetical protein
VRLLFLRLYSVIIDVIITKIMQSELSDVLQSVPEKDCVDIFNMTQLLFISILQQDIYLLLASATVAQDVFH